MFYVDDILVIYNTKYGNRWQELGMENIILYYILNHYYYLHRLSNINFDNIFI